MKNGVLLGTSPVTCSITVCSKFVVLTKYVDIYPTDLKMHYAAEDVDIQAILNPMSKIIFLFLFMICQSPTFKNV